MTQEPYSAAFAKLAELEPPCPPTQTRQMVLHLLTESAKQLELLGLQGADRVILGEEIRRVLRTLGWLSSFPHMRNAVDNASHSLTVLQVPRVPVRATEASEGATPCGEWDGTVYEACTFGLIRPADEDDGPEYGTIVLARKRSMAAAMEVLEKAFLDEPVKGNSPWIKAAIVWHPSRDPADVGRTYLWSMLPKAASAMDDENREPYPQTRPTHFWVQTFKVDE